MLLGSSIWASGTFILPPPVQRKVAIDPEQVKAGEEFFRKVNTSGRSCATCHDEKSANELKRRSLSRVFPRLLLQTNECLGNRDRLASEQQLTATDEEFLALRIYLASRFRLEEQLGSP